MGGGVVLKKLLEGKFTQAPRVPGQKNILLWPRLLVIVYKVVSLRVRNKVPQNIIIAFFLMDIPWNICEWI